MKQAAASTSIREFVDKTGLTSTSQYFCFFFHSQKPPASQVRRFATSVFVSCHSKSFQKGQIGHSIAKGTYSEESYTFLRYLRSFSILQTRKRSVTNQITPFDASILLNL